MANNKKALEKQILHLISDILLEEIENPTLQTINIIEVELNKDNSIAKVMVDAIGDTEKTIGLLKGAGSFIRQQLASRLDIRKMPYLEFVKDTKLDSLNNIERILEENK
jgi:ribosome-binding factor A